MGAPVLNTDDKCTLGKKIVESAALLEAGFASILQAESEKIEDLIKKNASKDDLKKANELLVEIVNGIKETEKLIIEKIKIGLSLCKSHDHNDCND